MKITLTQTEIKQMVARTFNLDISTFDLGITDNLSESGIHDDWWEIPSNWTEGACPRALDGVLIEVETRGGIRRVGLPNVWRRSWVQEGFASDIVRYRIVKNA